MNRSKWSAAWEYCGTTEKKRQLDLARVRTAMLEQPPKYVRSVGTKQGGSQAQITKENPERKYDMRRTSRSSRGKRVEVAEVQHVGIQ